MQRYIFGFMVILYFGSPTPSLDAEEPSIFANTKNWAVSPQTEEKIPFEEPKESSETKAENFPIGNRTGLYGHVGIILTVPQLSGQRLSSTFTPTYRTTFPTVDVAGIGSTYGPDAVIGYRVDCWGEVKLRYQGLYDTTRADISLAPQITNFANTVGPLIGMTEEDLTEMSGGTAAIVQSRFHVQTADIALSTDLIRLGAWGFKLEGGGRYGNFLLEDRTDGFFIHQMGRTVFDGFGPLVGLEIEREMNPRSTGRPTWFFSRVEGAWMHGQVSQTLEENINSRSAIVRQTQERLTEDRTVPKLAVELGIGMSDLPNLGMRVLVGYRYDRWFDVGKISDSNISLTGQGIFARVEWNY